MGPLPSILPRVLQPWELSFPTCPTLLPWSSLAYIPINIALEAATVGIMVSLAPPLLILPSMLARRLQPWELSFSWPLPLADLTNKQPDKIQQVIAND